MDVARTLVAAYLATEALAAKGGDAPQQQVGPDPASRYGRERMACNHCFSGLGLKGSCRPQIIYRHCCLSCALRVPEKAACSDVGRWICAINLSNFFRPAKYPGGSG